MSVNAKGKAYLVGAGPGDPELLTFKALRILRAADIVLHDELVAPEILSLASASALVRSVGKRCGRPTITQKEINSLLVTYAAAGLQVVRLKGGDPFIFGRGGEEIEALRNAGIDFEIVPGVTAALGAGAGAQIPLTHRNISSALVFITGQNADKHDAEQWQALVASGATLLIYMPGSDYPDLAEKLTAAGVKAETPCAIVSRATTPEEETHVTTVHDLPNTPKLAAPTVLIVGEVVRLAKQKRAAGEGLSKLLIGQTVIAFENAGLLAGD